MAAASNAEIGPATVHEYYQKLKTIRLDVLTAAAEVVIETWQEPHLMPTVPFILEAVASIQERGITDNARLLEEPRPDWKGEAGEFEAMLAESKKRAAQISDQNKAEAVKHEFPKAAAEPISDLEWQRRREEQLRQFREKNPEAVK